MPASNVIQPSFPFHPHRPEAGRKAAKTRAARAAKFYEARKPAIAEAIASRTLHKLPLTPKEAAPLLGLGATGVNYRTLKGRWKKQRNEVGHDEYFIPAKEFRKASEKLAPKVEPEAPVAVEALTEARVRELIEEHLTRRFGPAPR